MPARSCSSLFLTPSIIPRIPRNKGLFCVMGSQRRRGGDVASASEAEEAVSFLSPLSAVRGKAGGGLTQPYSGNAINLPLPPPPKTRLRTKRRTPYFPPFSTFFLTHCSPFLYTYIKGGRRGVAFLPPENPPLSSFPLLCLSRNISLFPPSPPSSSSSSFPDPIFHSINLMHKTTAAIPLHSGARTETTLRQERKCPFPSFLSP